MQVRACAQELFDRAVAPAAELTGYGVSPHRVRIDDAKQMNGKSILFELAVHAGVVAPEGANANDGDGTGLGGQTVILMAFLETLD